MIACTVALVHPVACPLACSYIDTWWLPLLLQCMAQRSRSNARLAGLGASSGDLMHRDPSLCTMLLGEVAEVT